MPRYSNIDHNRQIIFLHPNRCGGKSIENIIWKRPAQHKSSDHSLPKDFVKHYGITVWNMYFKFGFSRNPWDRIASLYYYRKNNLRKFPFSNLLEYLKFGEEEFKLDFIPQVTWFYLENEPINFIGRFENYDNDYANLCRLLNLDSNLPKLNSSLNRRPYRELFGKKEKSLVEKLFQADINTFNYNF